MGYDPFEEFLNTDFSEGREKAIDDFMATLPPEDNGSKEESKDAVKWYDWMPPNYESFPSSPDCDDQFLAFNGFDKYELPTPIPDLSEFDLSEKKMGLENGAIAIAAL